MFPGPFFRKQGSFFGSSNNATLAWGPGGFSSGRKMETYNPLNGRFPTSVLAEEVGFEPTVPSRVQRFSRPPPSTTRPLLRLARIIHRFSSRSGGSGGLTRRATGGRRRRTLTVRRGGRRSATQSGRVRSSPPSDEGGGAAVENLGIVQAG